MHRRRGPNFTYVSSCVKYMIFVLNFIFWLFGGLLIGVGLYAFIDKWQATGLIKLDTVYDVMLNISLLIALLGGVVFIVSFAGCVGALRENTCLLKFVSISTIRVRISPRAGLSKRRQLLPDTFIKVHFIHNRGPIVLSLAFCY
ncbi:tetraspanin family domain-containing protein [Phthorimaea operculella]|nr:tetraspanin family domain-containing protein [Phthorimaea operculella]